MSVVFLVSFFYHSLILCFSSEDCLGRALTTHLCKGKQMTFPCGLHNLIRIYSYMNFDASLSLSLSFSQYKDPRKIWKFATVTHVYYAPSRLLLDKAEPLISWICAKKEENKRVFSTNIQVCFLCYSNMGYGFWFNSCDFPIYFFLVFHLSSSILVVSICLFTLTHLK